MADYFNAYKKTMRHEGGYSLDKDDAGGETFMGISRKFNPDWAGWEKIDLFKQQHPKALIVGSLSSSDFFRAVNNSQELANDTQLFYKGRYWDVFAGDQIKDQELAREMFDTGINMGTHRAIKFLQQGLNFLNRDQALFADLVEDGAFGMKTLDALSLLPSDDMEILLKIMNVLQGMHYLDYMKKSPTQEKYCRGWFKRVSISK